MKHEVKLCPFCGTFPEVKIVNAFIPVAYINCPFCGNRTRPICLDFVDLDNPLRSISYRQLKKLIKRWNNWKYVGVLGE